MSRWCKRGVSEAFLASFVGQLVKRVTMSCVAGFGLGLKSVLGWGTL